jgi:hypothetical protein
MSQIHIRKPKPPPEPVVWWRVGIILAIPAVVIGAGLLISNWVHSFPSSYKTANGKILEIRKVVDRISESQYGSSVIYRVEAHVQYSADGQAQDRWLRASDDLPRESLLIKLAGHPTECLLYWPPDHPENAKCSFK